MPLEKKCKKQLNQKQLRNHRYPRVALIYKCRIILKIQKLSEKKKIQDQNNKRRKTEK